MSNRRFVHTYILEAEFDGAGGLVADPYPLYPRAFLWAHLNDGVMETVVTNWGNDGLYMEGVGPSLVGRAFPDLGPLQQINLGGALYFDADGNLSYDPSAMLAQIAQLQQQVAVLNSQVQLLYATIKQSAFNPYGQAGLSGSGALAASLGIPLQLIAPTLSGSGNLRAVVGFELPTRVSGFFGSGGISAAVLGAINIKSTMAGASSGIANLTQVPSSFKQLGTQLFVGAGGGTSKLGVGLAATAALTGFGHFSVNLPVALRGSALLAGSGVSTVQLRQTQLSSATLAGAGGVAAAATIPAKLVGLDQVGIYQFLSGNPATATNVGIVHPGSNALLVGLSVLTASDISSAITVSWASQAMVLLGNALVRPNQVLLYGLLAPITGTNTLTVTNADGAIINAISFTGVNQSSLATAFQNVTPALFSVGVNGASVTVPSALNCFVVGMFAGNFAMSGTNWFTSGSNPQPFTSGGYAVGAAPSVTLNANQAGTGTAVALGISISP